MGGPFSRMLIPICLRPFSLCVCVSERDDEAVVCCCCCRTYFTLMCTIKVHVHLVACNVWESSHEGVFAAGLVM